MKRFARLLLLTMWAGSCAPHASSVPLGLGPLAVAERDADAADRLTHRPAIPAKPKVEREGAPTPASAKKEPALEGEPASSDETDGEDSDGPAKTAAGKADTPAFEGLYAGEDVAIYRLSGLLEREEKDDKAQIRIEKGSASSVTITIGSENGSDFCAFVARVEGNAALLESPQPCFTSEGEGAIQAELTSGRAVVDGDKLTMVAEGKLSALGDQDVEGELEYSFKGERK